MQVNGGVAVLPVSAPLLAPLHYPERKDCMCPAAWNVTLQACDQRQTRVGRETQSEEVNHNVLHYLTCTCLPHGVPFTGSEALRLVLTYGSSAVATQLLEKPTSLVKAM